MGKKVTVLSIFIATAISVSVVFLFRTLDRDNNSMEKITRYAKKLMGDFDEYFKKQREQLNVVSADLQTQQTMASAAVKRLAQQTDEFKRASAGFDEQFAAVDTIGRQLESYNGVLNELMDMTTRVEENLEHIRKESNIIDDLSSAIATQKKTVDAIEKKIPQINEKFIERNNESLKTISTELLNQYQARAESIDRSTAAAAERSEKTLAKLEGDIRRVYDEAAQKAARLDDAAFKRLAEQMQGRNGRLAEELDARAKELEVQMQAKIAELSNHLRNETEAVKKQFGDTLVQAKNMAKELNAEVNGNGKILETLRASLETKIHEVQTRYNQLYENAIADVDAKETAAYTKFQKISSDHVLGYKNMVEEEIKTMQNTVDATISGIDEDIKQKIGAVRDDVNAKVAGLQGSLQAAEQAKTDLEAFQKQVDEQIAAVNTKLAQLTERLSTVYDTKQTELLSLVDSQLDGYRKNLEYRFGRLEKIEADVGSLEDTLKQTLEQTRGRVMGEFTAFTTAQTQKNADFERIVNANRDDITKQIAQLESQLNDMQTSANDDMSAKLKAFEERFSADLQQRGARIDGDLSAWKQTHDAKLTSLADEFENARREIETKQTDNLKTAFADYEAQVQAKVAELTERLRTETEAVKNQFNETLAMSAELKAFEERFNADLQQRGDRIDSDLNAWKQSHDAKLTSLADEFENTRREIETKQADEIKASLAEHEAQVQAKIAELAEQLRNETEEVKNQFKETLAQAHVTAGELKAELEGNGETLQSLRTSLESQMADIQTRYNQLYEKAIADADEKEREAYTRLQSDAADYLAKYKGDVEEKIKAMQSTVDAEISTADTSLKDKIGAVRSEVDETVAGLQNSLQAAERSKSDLEAFQKQADEQIGEVREKLAQLREQLSAVCDERQTDLLEQVESQFTGYRENLEYRFEKLERIGTDVDALEENLRRALELTKGSVMGEFTAFAAAQEQKQADFAQRFKSDSDDLAGKIALLEGQLNDIQISASDDMSAKLRAFEERFNADLQQRGDRIDHELDAWKQTHDAQLTSLADAFDTSRRDFAAKHADDLKSAIADQEARTQADIAELAEHLRGETEAVRNQFAETLAQAHETAGVLRAELDSNSKMLSTMRTSLESQIGEVREKLAQLREQLSAVCDERQTELLEQVESQFSGYRENLEYRFEKLERIGTDVDALEENLRQTLELTKGSVMGEFTAFVAAQEQKRGEFERTFKAGNDDLANGLAQLEGQLNDLKATASENVSATLKVFEEKFNADLQRRGNRIDDELNTWKRDLDEKLDTLTGGFESERHAIETKYTNDLKTNLADQEARAQADIAAFTERLRTDTESLANRLGETLEQATQMARELEAEQNGNGETLKTLRASLESQIADLQARSDKLYQDAVADAMEKEGETYARVQEFVAQQLEGYKNAVEARINAMQGDVDASINTVDEELREKLNEVQGDMKTTIGIIDSELRSKIDKVQDNAEADINAVDAQVRQRIDTMQDGVDATIDTFDTEVKEKIDIMQSDVNSIVTTLDTQMRQKIGTMQNDMNSVINTLDTEMKQKIGTMQSDVDSVVNTLDAQVRQRIDAMQSGVDATIDTFDTEVKEKIDIMQNDVNSIVTTFDAQMRQKIGTMQNDMNSVISTLDTEMKQKIGTMQSDVDSVINTLDAQVWQRIDTIQNDVDTTINTFDTEVKQKIGTMQNNVNSVITTFDTQMRQKIGTMQNDVDSVVNTLDAQVRQKIDTMQNGVDMAINTLDTQVSDKISAVQDEVNGRVAGLQESLQTAARTKAELQTFQAQTDEQIAAVRSNIEHLKEEVSTVYGAKQEELLNTMETQIDKYRANLEYRLRQLEKTESDIDVLGENLRQSLMQVEGRVNDTFSAYTAAQEQQQADFAQRVKDKNDDIAEQIALIASQVNELKATASENVSATLKDFEENFGMDLRRRSDDIEERLNAWKQRLDTELIALTGDYEEKRRELETKYLEELKERIEELEAQGREQTQRYETGISTTLDDINRRVTNTEQTVNAFIDKANIDLQSVTDSFNKLLESNFSAYGQRINEVIAKAQQETEERLAAIEQTVHEHKETHKSNIDTMRGDLQTWQKLLKSQFDDSKELVIKQLTSLRDTANLRIEEIKSEFEQSLAAFRNSAHGKQVEINAGMDVLQKQVAAALADYETRSAQILDEQQNMYEEMLQETKRRIDEQTSNSEKTVRDLREQIQKVTDEADRLETDMTMRMQSDAADLQTRFSEIDQQVKAFASQMQVYQTADKLQAKLDAEISKLNNDLAKVDTYQPAVQRLLASFGQLQGMNEDASNKLARFEAQKAHIDSLNTKFDRLLSMSNNMDAKIQELHTTNDDLQNVQIAVRKFQDTLGDISNHYDRLEKKQEVIEQVTADVDKSFDNLKELERRMDDAVRQSATIPEALKGIQRDIDTLMSNTDKVNDAVDKIASIESVLSETEQRIQQVQTARTGIAGVETRLQNLDKEIERKMGVLLRATQADLEKNPGQVAHGITPQDREAIVQLKKQGWTVDEIARRMHRSVSEVELILEMPSD